MNNNIKNHTPYIKRFLISGLFIFLIDFLTYSGLISLSVSINIANLIGMTAGFLLGFILHKEYTFQLDTHFSIRLFLKYLLGFMFNLCLAYFLLNMLYTLLAAPYLAKLITMVCVIISNFIISRFLVFINPSSR